MRFSRRKTIDVALKCSVCKEIQNYPIDVFPRKEYKAQGFLMQFCGCDKWQKGKVISRNGNTKHKIVGVFVEEQIPLSHDEAKELLGDLIATFGP